MKLSKRSMKFISASIIKEYFALLITARVLNIPRFHKRNIVINKLNIQNRIRNLFGFSFSSAFIESLIEAKLK